MLTNGTPNPQNAADEGIQPSGRLSFRDYLAVGIARSLLKDQEYTGKILNVKPMLDPTDPTKDYVRIEIQLDFDGRIIVENRFESGWFIAERELKIQLGLQDQSMPLPLFMEALINQPVKIWYKTQTSPNNNRSYQNLFFSKPVEAPAATGAVPQF